MVPLPEERPQVNVIAELPGKNDDNVVMAGAHLDSVQAGPGINDNGSGSASLLEIAQQMSKVKPENTVRLAWWGAEEAGLLGSQAYVDGLSQAEKDRIALYLNFDMVASPNYIFMIYDGDESQFQAPVVVPEGSVQIEDLFESYFTSVGEPYDDAEFSGRSDYEAFILEGIPAGGLFTGAEVPQDRRAGGDLGRCRRRVVRPVLPPGVRHDRQRQRVRARREHRRDRAHGARLLLLHGVGQRRGRQEHPGWTRLPVPAGPEGTTGSGGGHSHGDVE